LLAELLKRYWGYDHFRPSQPEIINAVLEGRDTFAMLPTGGGKSICYQLPALANEGLCLVISPLIALMQDQVTQLQQKGIEAAYLHSGMSQRQIRSVLERAADNSYKLLYIAPERIRTESFLQFAGCFTANLIAVDEAHCISQWGHDFRPAYRKIDVLKEMFPGVPTLALTASATREVQQDIINQLRLKNPHIVLQSVVRSNLFYHVRYTENKPADTVKAFQDTKGSGILYCRSRRRCAESALLLQSNNITAGVYHAGMPKAERDLVQKKWTGSDHMIISATTAFGMGIDKPDVRMVVHYDAPEHPEAYYQEAGRAGRDGADACAVLFYNITDINRLRESASVNFPPEKFIKQVYSSICDYLQLPLGSGDQELRIFDSITFARNFNLEILKTLSAIKLLEQEGLWIWNENTATRTSIQFTTDRNTLEHLAKYEPSLAYVTTNLLRLYGSIFHHPTYINEYEDSKMMRIDKAELDIRLSRLAALGVISYQPAINGGTLFFQHNRVQPGHLSLDTRRINRLRKAFEQRAAEMIAFMENRDKCRNIALAAYFGEKVTQECGKCDVCLKHKQEQDRHSYRDEVRALIRQRKIIALQDISGNFPRIPMSTIIDYIRTLSDERFCSIAPSGVITLIQKDRQT